MDDHPSAKFMSAIVDHVAHPIFVKDREFRFVVLNRAFEHFVGYSREEMLGKTDYDFFPKEQSDFFREKDVEMFSSEAAVQIEEEPITDADGNEHILATTKVPYRNEDGEVTHLIGIIKDITKLKHAEALLRDANEELERRVRLRTRELAAAQDELVRKERLAVLGQLAGGLAHQLRNPLATIQNAVAVLRKETGAETRDQTLSIIEEEVRRADRTIRDLLDYAAIRPPTLQPVWVRALVEQCIELERPDPHIGVELAIDDEARVLADPSQALAAIGNVLRNALEAVEFSAEPRVGISADRSGDRVRIIVSDNGKGVDASARERLFEPLVTTKPLGIGLGLPIARALAQNQGGDIRLGPSPPEGAAFVIEMPAAPKREVA